MANALEILSRGMEVITPIIGRLNVFALAARVSQRVAMIMAVLLQM